MIRLLSLGDGVPRLVEQNVPGLRRFLYICGETVKVFNGSGVNLVDNIVVENQPETVALHYGDVVTPKKVIYYMKELVYNQKLFILCILLDNSVLNSQVVLFFLFQILLLSTVQKITRV